MGENFLFYINKVVNTILIYIINIVINIVIVLEKGSVAC